MIEDDMQDSEVVVYHFLRFGSTPFWFQLMLEHRSP